MITSLDNKRVKEWTKLHQKKYRGEEYLLLSEPVIKCAKEAGCLKTLIYAGEPPFEAEESVEVSREVLAKIAKNDEVSFVGIGQRIKMNDSYKNRVIILDELQDPLNIGRIAESAYLFGFDSMILSPNTADIYHEKCLKASKGTVYKLNIMRNDLESEIAKLQMSGFIIYATGLRDNTRELYEVETSEKMAFVLGNEGSGVEEKVLNIADEIVKIDMHNIDSLNVAMAGAIVMHRFRKM